jgi:hypothetical protein
MCTHEDKQRTEQQYCHAFQCDYRGFTAHLYNSLLYFKNHYHTPTSVLSLLVSTSRCLVAASNGGRSPSSEFQKPSSASATSFSQQQFTMTELQFSNSLTHQLFLNSTPMICPAYISARTAQKAPFLITVVSSCRGIAEFVSVGRNVAYQRLLYGCLFRGRCLGTGLYVTILSLSSPSLLFETTYHSSFGINLGVWRYSVLSPRGFTIYSVICHNGSYKHTR